MRHRQQPQASILHLMLISVLSLISFGCQDGKQNASDTGTSQDSAKTTTEVASSTENPIATTQYGPVRGYIEDNIVVFKGIRYGADTATTRFAPPAAPAPWTEPADATSYGNSAPQTQRAVSIGLFDSWVTDPQPGLSEDCLFLNVWTPAVADQGKRPVLVWFHGGGFSSGSGSSNAYDGARLANRGDVVVVTVNHRLNVFGYLYLDEYGEQFAGSANAGMLDLVASLEWVRDNISQFGGDPDKVLIFGESGGGFKVSTLMAMDAATGLFHRAVVQSGPGLELFSKADAAAGTVALIAELGLDESTIEQIRTLPAEQIATAAAAVAEDGGPQIGGRPAVDGVHNLRHPFTPEAPDQSVDIPLLIGSTQTEMSLLGGARQPELFELTWETCRPLWKPRLKGSMPPVLSTAIAPYTRRWTRLTYISRRQRIIASSGAAVWIWQIVKWPRAVRRFTSTT